MNHIKIFFNPLDAKSLETFEVRPNTQIIEFLQERFPEGLGGFTRVFVGGDEIQLEDLDYTLSDEQQVVMLVMPGEPLTTALIYAAVSFAVGVVINLLFPPSQPGGGGGDNDPVYTLATPRNTARLGQPIEVHYGSVVYTPSLAMAPYTFYSNGPNDQYVDMLFCLGWGELDVTSVLIGETPIEVLAGDAAKYWVFKPDDHKQTRGEIAKQILSYERDSGTPMRFFENMFTSPELSDPGFFFDKDKSDIVAAETPIAGEVHAGYEDPNSGIWYPGYISWIPETNVSADGPSFTQGDRLTLTNTNNNNVSVILSSVVTLNNGNMALYEGFNDRAFTDETLPGGATYTLNVPYPDMIAGPYRAQKEGMFVNRIYVDFVLPQGLHHISSSGNVRGKTVSFKVTYQRIDEFGTPVDLPIEYTHSITAKTRSPIRRTYSSKAVPHGMYEVTVQRLSDPEDDNDNYVSNLYWSGLRSSVVNVAGVPFQGPIYHGTTMMALRMRATNGLGQAARERVRVAVTRKKPGTDETLDNPAEVIADIFTNTDYGMGRDVSELDIVDLEEGSNRFEVSDGVHVNGSFSTKGTGYSALQNTAGLVAGKVVQEGSVTTVVLDRIQEVRTAMFTSANIIRDTLQVNYEFNPYGAFNGVRVEYRDPTNFTQKYITWPDGATDPQNFTLFGCTDEEYAYVYAQYLWQSIALRRKRIQFDTEADGLLPRFGDRIAVSHPLADWGQSGVILADLGGGVYRVDQPLEFTAGKNHVALIRDQYGKPAGPYSVRQGPAPNQLEFIDAPGQVFVPSDQQEPTSYAFGTTDDHVTDWIVEKISPRGGNLVQVKAQTYDARIFDNIDMPFACDAISSTAANGGYNYYWELMPPPEDQEFPFATTRPNTWGEDGNASIWGGWIANPNQQTVWATDPGYFSLGSMDGWDWAETARKLVFCGTEDTGGAQIVNVKGNSSVVHLSPPTTVYQDAPVNGSSANVVFTGYQGGHHVEGTINRETAAIYALYVGGVYKFNVQCPVFVSMAPSSSGGPDEYSAYITVGQDGGEFGQRVNVEIPFGTVHGRWLNYTFSESCTTEVIQRNAPQAAQCIVRCNVTVTVTGQDGQTAQGTAEGAIETGSTAGFAELIETWTSNAYNWPGMFSGTEGLQYTLAHLSAFGGTVDHAFMRQGFLRNFT